MDGRRLELSHPVKVIMESAVKCLIIHKSCTAQSGSEHVETFRAMYS